MHYDFGKNIPREVEHRQQKGSGLDQIGGGGQIATGAYNAHYDIERIIQREVEHRLDRGSGSD